MRLKNILIVVKDIERSRRFYHDIFGLEMILDNDGNMILTEGLALQEEKYWREFLGKEIVPRNNASELYFEEEDIEGFVDRLMSFYPDTEFVNTIMTHSWGQKVVRFYDPDGNLIEVGTPMQNEERKTMKLSVIFDDKPERWGFRGDPYFWDYLKDLAENMDVLSETELEEWIKKEYLSLSGKELTDEYMDFAVVKQFAHGGMSSGGIDNQWWMEEGIPLLKSRLTML